MKSKAYYNENDLFAAAWLRELIKEGLIADGEIDTRSIVDVRANDLQGFTQCHFFAGIGGWSLAFRLAGIPDDYCAWSMSCPCPPFSVAGKKKFCPECQGGDLIACPRRTGFFVCCGCSHAWMADERHLWPEGWRLIRDARPDCPIFGEQVASPDGRIWLASVRASLDLMAYDTWAVDLCSAGIGKDHIRQRLGWVAYPDGWLARHRELQPGWQHGFISQDGIAGQRLADTTLRGQRIRRRASGHPGHADIGGAANRVGNPEKFGRDIGEYNDDPAKRHKIAIGVGMPTDGLGEPAEGRRRSRRTGEALSGEQSCGAAARSGADSRMGIADSAGSQPGQPAATTSGHGHPTFATSDNSDWLGDPNQSRPQERCFDFRKYADQWLAGPGSVAISCSDGKWRRVPANAQGEPEPALFPLADARAFRNRVGMLRGSGNAIDPFLWSQFIAAFLETEVRP